MPKVEVIEGKIQHCGMMSRMLRAEHLEAIEELGVSTHHSLRETFESSAYRKSLMIDGELAAMGGVAGSLCSSRGQIWFALTERARCYPLTVARVAKQQITEVMRTKRELDTVIIPNDKTSLRFVTFLGFELAHNVPITMGRGHVIAMRYEASNAR